MFFHILSQTEPVQGLILGQGGAAFPLDCRSSGRMRRLSL
jgi:hypothetical protein